MGESGQTTGVLLVSVGKGTNFGNLPKGQVNLMFRDREVGIDDSKIGYE